MIGQLINQIINLLGLAESAGVLKSIIIALMVVMGLQMMENDTKLADAMKTLSEYSESTGKKIDAAKGLMIEELDSVRGDIEYLKEQDRINKDNFHSVNYLSLVKQIEKISSDKGDIKINDLKSSVNICGMESFKEYLSRKKTTAQVVLIDELCKKSREYVKALEFSKSL